MDIERDIGVEEQGKEKEPHVDIERDIPQDEQPENSDLKLQHINAYASRVVTRSNEAEQGLPPPPERVAVIDSSDQEFELPTQGGVEVSAYIHGEKGVSGRVVSCRIAAWHVLCCLLFFCGAPLSPTICVSRLSTHTHLSNQYMTLYHRKPPQSVLKKSKLGW